MKIYIGYIQRARDIRSGVLLASPLVDLLILGDFVLEGVADLVFHGFVQGALIYYPDLVAERPMYVVLHDIVLAAKCVSASTDVDGRLELC